MIWVGIDVDAKHLVCQRLKNNRRAKKTFSNEPKGHEQLLAWSTEAGCRTRVCMEATGVYSFLVASTLHEHDDVEVSVVNPRLIKNFAHAWLQRGKTDEMDARTILEYLLRMPFEVWQSPQGKLLELQLLSRRVLQLTTELRREKSRRHAALRMGRHGQFLVNDLEVNIRHIQRRIDVIEQKMVELVEEEDRLTRRLEQLRSIKGIAKKSGPRILAELASLPEDMTARQWVAYAGLDPRPYESGSLVKPRRLSKQGNRYLRDSMYLPSLSASHTDEHVSAYYQALIKRGKKPKQAIVAVMRKLLLAIWGMFKSGENWDGEKFYRMPS